MSRSAGLYLRLRKVRAFLVLAFRSPSTQAPLLLNVSFDSLSQEWSRVVVLAVLSGMYAEYMVSDSV